jgi:hypothetical protein
MDLTLEVGREPLTTVCEHCGGMYQSSAGFIHCAGGDFAIYWAALLGGGDHEQRADLAIAIGTWDKRAKGTASAFISIWPSVHGPRMSFVDPPTSGWPRNKLLSHQLTADEALRHPRRSEFLEIAELVLRGDPAVSSHLA